MRYCTNCGQKNSENASFCAYCGNCLYGDSYDKETNVNNKYYEGSNNRNGYDSGSFGYAILGFIIPIVGLVLYLVWKVEKPKSAKMAGAGALANFILGIVFFVLIFVLIAAAASL